MTTTTKTVFTFLILFFTHTYIVSQRCSCGSRVSSGRSFGFGRSASSSRSKIRYNDFSPTGKGLFIIAGSLLDVFFVYAMLFRRWLGLTTYSKRCSHSLEEHIYNCSECIFISVISIIVSLIFILCKIDIFYLGMCMVIMAFLDAIKRLADAEC